MGQAFDPYHKWLGIPPAKQPPNHYRLLGLTLFESDTDVILSAAEQRIAHVRTFQISQHAELSQRLLNELAAARVCLLKPQEKLAYDSQLRQKLGAAHAPPSGALEVAAVQFQPPTHGPAPSVLAARVITNSPPLSQTPTAFAPSVTRFSAAPHQPGAEKPPQTPLAIAVAPKLDRPRRHFRQFTALASAGGIAVGLLVIAAVAMSARNHNEAVPESMSSSAANPPTSGTAKSDENQLAHDATKSQPRSLSAAERTSPAANGPARSNRDVPANAPYPDPSPESNRRETDVPNGEAMGADTSADDFFSDDDSADDFFDDDDSAGASPKAPSMPDFDDFFSDDDAPEQDPAEFFDSEN